MLKKPLNKRLWPGRVPPFVPEWMRKRIEVNLIQIHELMEFAQRTIQPHETVLDAGAGEGRFRHYFAHANYIGVDFGKGDQAWDYAALDVNADLLELPVASSSVDNVVCTQTLEHVRNPQQVLNEIGRVLKPGGRLFLSVPLMWHQHQKPHDYFRYTQYSLDMLYRNAGMEPQFIKPMGGYFWSLSYQLQMLHHWVTRPADGSRQSIPALLLSLVIRVFFLLLLPIPLYYLDVLDEHKDATMGFVCYCIKQPADTL